VNDELATASATTSNSIVAIITTCEVVQLTFHSLTARASCNPFKSSEATEATEATRVAVAAAARTGDAWHTHSPRCAVGHASGPVSIARYKVVIRREV
jgi:hypothetical protein